VDEVEGKQRKIFPKMQDFIQINWGGKGKAKKVPLEQVQNNAGSKRYEERQEQQEEEEVKVEDT